MGSRTAPRFALLAALLIGFAAIAQAAPPWDLTVNVTDAAFCVDENGDPTADPVTACPIDSRELFIDGELVGTVGAGDNVFPAEIEAAGTYEFRVDWINAAGRTQGDPVTVTITDLSRRGKGTITITVSCDPCVQTTQ